MDTGFKPLKYILFLAECSDHTGVAHDPMDVPIFLSISHCCGGSQWCHCSEPVHIVHNTFKASGELSEDIVDDTWDGTRRVDIDANGKIFPGMVVAEYQRPLGRLEARLIRPPI